MPLRYAELTPEELDQTWSQRPLAIVPWGALEWHGPHLPLGLDGIVAEEFASRLADRTGGVLLPGCWMPITTLPHPASQQLRTEAFRMLMDDLLEGLYSAGARLICVVTGHYAQGHEIELYRAAQRAMDGHLNLNVLAATPLEVLGEDDLLDHAGRWEAAQLLAMRPELVKLDLLPAEIKARRHAVLGEDPRQATADDGNQVLERALQTWSDWIDEILATRETNFVRAFYAKRMDDYARYIRTYFTESWEQALHDWWLTLER